MSDIEPPPAGQETAAPANDNIVADNRPEVLAIKVELIRYIILAIKAHLAASEKWMRETSAAIRHLKRRRAFLDGRARLVEGQRGNGRRNTAP
jgi:hypothetical protein